MEAELFEFGEDSDGDGGGERGLMEVVQVMVEASWWM